MLSFELPVTSYVMHFVIFQNHMSVEDVVLNLFWGGKRAHNIDTYICDFCFCEISWILFYVF